MQQTDRVAVLATHLADTDRRALSQAWYSALHLADRAARPLRAPNCRSGPSGLAAFPRGPALAATGASPPTAGAVAQAAHAPRSMRAATAPHRSAAETVSPGMAQSAPAGTTKIASDGAAERRAPSELADRIERALTDHAPHAPRGGAASFTVRAESGRVHVLVRSDGARTRLVAVCAPPLRERVERALAQVRFALAGRGMHVCAEVA